jgi:glucose dehydrogenase
MVDGALIGTTEHDIFSIDPATCHQNWRISEDYTPATSQAVNRGAAYLDGRLFRGTEDGRVLAYDFATGKRVWETSVANPKIGETAPSAPIAWNGLVFIGTAGGDIKGVKSRMYALDALTGKIVWGFIWFQRPKGIRFAVHRAHRHLTPRHGKMRLASRSLAAALGPPIRWIRPPDTSMCQAATQRPISRPHRARETIYIQAPLWC